MQPLGLEPKLTVYVPSCFLPNRHPTGTPSASSGLRLVSLWASGKAIHTRVAFVYPYRFFIFSNTDIVLAAMSDDIPDLQLFAVAILAILRRTMSSADSRSGLYIW